MSHIFEIGVEGQTVNFQSLALLDGSSSLANLVTNSSSNSGVCSGDFVFEDEGDVFQCGRCKRQFGSLTVFMMHKREGCSNSSSISHVSLKSEPTKDCHSLPGGHYLTENYISENIQGDEREFESVHSNVHSVSSLSLSQGQHEEQMTDNVDMAGSSLIHMTPSIVLSDDTISVTIPVDHNSQLGQLIAAGSNSSTVLQIPESELRALLAAERYHISGTENGNSGNSHGFFLAASLLPSNGKEPLSEKNLPADSTQYVDVTTDHLNSSTLFQLKRDSVLNSGDVELPIRLNKTSDASEEITVIRMRKDKLVDLANRENTRQQQRHQKQKPVKASTSGGNRISVVNTTASSNQKPEEVTESKRKCEYCGKPFKKLFNLHQHIRSHTGEKPFHCLVCGRGFTQKSNVKKHMQTHKVWPKVKYTLPREQISVKLKDTEQMAVDECNGESKNTDSVEYIVNNVYVCQYCDQHFGNYHKLKTHLSHTHKNEKLFKCIHKDCLATFMEVEGLISHMKTHENQIEYQCQNCPRKFKNLYDLGAHQYTHRHPNKPTAALPKNHRCTKCNSKYASAEALNHHLLTSSHNYPCSQCQLTFVCERYLRRHLRIHGTVEPFKCDHLGCGKMFKTENYLKSHLVIHSDSKPFHCEVCKQAFNRRDKLTRHKLMHDNRKKYKCPYKHTGCEREFYRKDKLKDHMMSHSRTVCACSKCGKTFSWPVRLRKHQATCHPEMLINTTCASCQKIFKTKHHLKMHVCKEASAIVENDLMTDENVGAEPEGDMTPGIIIAEEAIKEVVLFNGCEMEDSINSNEEKCGPGIMLGSFTHVPDDPETVIFTRYTASMEDKVCPDLESGMGLPFETGVEGHIDQFITTDD